MKRHTARAEGGVGDDRVSLTEQLRERIAREGPISVADYVAAANAHYYAARDPLGEEGDFTTAPEISQMFGELIGLWLADLWLRAGRPVGARYVELGPGRGTLADDALRAMRGAGLAPPVDLVETSPTLRAAQRALLPAARWHDAVDTLPRGAPLLIVANEFFDALPVRQFVSHQHFIRSLVVKTSGDHFARVPGAPASWPPFSIELCGHGQVIEDSPMSQEIVRELARRLVAGGGAALIIDYGHDRHGWGDTLQAVRRHEPADPWVNPGTCDLTAHVDFQALSRAAQAEGVRVFGPVGQGAWLRFMGIDLRAASLAKAAPERTEEIVLARERLTAPEHMGSLFRVLALIAPGWPVPEAF